MFFFGGGRLVKIRRYYLNKNTKADMNSIKHKLFVVTNHLILPKNKLFGDEMSWTFAWFHVIHSGIN